MHIEYATRSEERRVGKECRSRCDWSSDVCSSDLAQASHGNDAPLALRVVWARNYILSSGTPHGERITDFVFIAAHKMPLLNVIKNVTAVTFHYTICTLNTQQDRKSVV